MACHVMATDRGELTLSIYRSATTMQSTDGTGSKTKRALLIAIIACYWSVSFYLVKE